MMLFGGLIWNFHQLIYGTFLDRTGMNTTPKKIFQKRKQNLEIHYKEPIWDKLYKAIYDADVENKIIDYIVVDDEEWNQLCRWFDRHCVYNDFDPIKGDSGKFYGVKVYRNKPIDIVVTIKE